MAFLLMGVLSLSAPAAPHPYEVKAALLHGFTKFMQWPEGSFATPESPLVIGLVGLEAFENRFEAVLKDKSSQGRPVEVRHLQASAEEATNCHLVYLGPQLSDREQGLLKRLATSPVLTVGETDDAWDQGVIIQFLRWRNRIHFRIRLDAADKTGLRIDPSLLKVAHEVKGSKQPARPAPSNRE